MLGALGWLVTAWMVAVQFAAAAAAKVTIGGVAARVTKPGSRRGSTASTRTGNASSTSGCTATAAPASQAARLGRSSPIARTAYSTSPTATASSG